MYPIWSLFVCITADRQNKHGENRFSRFSKIKQQQRKARFDIHERLNASVRSLDSSSLIVRTIRLKSIHANSGVSGCV
jgi:hypothetical protein